MRPIIEVKKLSKIFKIPKKQSFFRKLLHPQYRDFTAVNEVSFDIKKGESVALLGPNGAGKTTTMKMLTGILYPTSGEISVMGYEPQKRNKEMLKKIGFVMGSKSTLSMDLSPMQNYELNRVIYDIDSIDFYNTIDELAELLEVGEHLNKMTRTLSLGQRMKADLIASILHKPEILYLDEPTIGLDITSQNNIRAFLKRVNKDFGTTLFLTSHNMEDIERVSDRVMIITKGQLVYDDSLEKLKREFSTKKYIKIIFDKKISSKEHSVFKKLGSIVEAKNDYLRIEIDKKNQSVVLQEILDLPNVQDIDLEGVPLSKIIERVFQQK